MITSLKLSFLLCVFASLIPYASSPQMDAKNPGCDPTIHICPTEPEAVNVM